MLAMSSMTLKNVLVPPEPGNNSYGTLESTIHLALQGNESDAAITYPTEVNVTGWKTTDDGILSLRRYPVLCHEGMGISTEYSNCTGSIGVGKECLDEFDPDLRHIEIVIGDIDNDTINDIVFISNVKEEDYLNTGTKVYLMPSRTLAWEKDIAGHGVIADINNDGKNEVVVVGADYYKGNVSVYAFWGENGTLLWEQDAEICPQPISFNIPVNTIIAGDVNNDSNDDILIGTPNGLFILNGTDGSMMWNYIEYGNISTILLVDIDNDGINEIITGARDIWNVFALSAVDEVKIWDNSEENAILLAPKVGYINPDEHKDLVIQHVGVGQDALVAYSLNNGTVLWVSNTLMGACSHSFRPPDFMDINGDGYNDVFATHDMVSFYFYNGENGTILKEHGQIGHVHYLDFDEEREKIVAGIDETSLRLALLNSTGDIVWNIDAGVGVYEEYPGDLGFLRPDVIGDYIFTFIASSSSNQPDQYLALANFSNGYIFRKYPLPFLDWSRLPDIEKVDINGDGVDEFIVLDFACIYIINKSILYDNEIYEPNETLEPGIYTYTLNYFNPDTGENLSVTRTLTIVFSTLPQISNPYPPNGSTGINPNATLNITISDSQGDTMGITWCSNSSGSWQVFGINNSVGNGTYYQTNSNFSSYNKTYWWSVSCTDGSNWTNATHHFTTESASVNDQPTFSGEAPSNKSTGVSISTSSLSIAIEDPEGDMFNWMIETSPNIGNNSGTDEGNGTKSCNISGLSYDTTYTWYVNATDTGSGNWTNNSYIFTTESHDDSSDDHSSNPYIPPQNSPPSADAGEPYTGCVNQNITFNGSGSSDSDGSIENYTWDFGDEHSGYGRIINHSYSNLGNYTVNLTVTDNEGETNTDSTIITIYENTTNNENISNCNILDDDKDGIVNNMEEKLGSNPDNASDVKNVTVNQSTYFLVDTDQDGMYDVLYHPATGNTTALGIANGKTILLDVDEDGHWDYRFDGTKGILTTYIKGKTTTKQLPFVPIEIVVLAILITVVSTIVFLQYRKKIKTRIPQFFSTRAEQPYASAKNNKNSFSTFITKYFLHFPSAKKTGINSKTFLPLSETTNEVPHTDFAYPTQSDGTLKHYDPINNDHRQEGKFDTFDKNKKTSSPEDIEGKVDEILAKK